MFLSLLLGDDVRRRFFFLSLSTVPLALKRDTLQWNGLALSASVCLSVYIYLYIYLTLHLLSTYH